MTSKRETNYDFLRVMAMIAVIMTHVSGTWLNGLWDFAVAGMSTSEMMHPYMAPLYYSAARFAVPCFVMLSGAFVMADSRNREYLYFYRKILRRVGIPTLVFSLLYILYGIPSCIWGENSGPLGVRSFIEQIISGAPHYHMWYMYMIIGVYTLAPAAIRFKESISEKAYTRVTVIFMILAGISAWTSDYMMNWDVGLVFEYLGYFMIGDVIRTRMKKKNTVLGVFMIAAGLLIEACIAGYIYDINYIQVIDPYSIRLDMLNYLGLPVVGASILIFMGFGRLKLRERKWITTLSGLSMYVYLFHALVYDLIRKCFRMVTHMRIYMYRYLDGLIAIPVLTVIVLLISCAAAKLWILLIRKAENRYGKYDG